MGRPLGAQARSTLELGASYVRFPDDSTSIAGPSVRWTSALSRGAFGSSMSVSAVGATTGVSSYGEATGYWLTALGAGWGGELSGEGSALLSTAQHSSATPSTTGVVSARLLRPLGDGDGGVWLRGSGAVAHREAGSLWGRGIDAGTWWRRAGLELMGALAQQWSMAQLFLGPGRQNIVGAVPVHYVEGSAGALVGQDQASLAVTAQLRRDPGAERLYEPGFSATGTFWYAPSRAVFVNVAKQLPDFVHGADALQSVTVGIRLNEPSPAAARVRAIRPIVQVSAAGAADSSGSSLRRTLRVRAPGASQVEVMGDFSGWEPVTLVSTGDVFSASVDLSVGTHRLVVRIDGGPWIPAANTPAVDDDFGGKVGLLVVQ